MTKVSGHAIRPRTLAAIIEAAVRMLSVDPGVTMGEVARGAGVGRATLHRHFKGKADLLRTITARCIEETNAAVLATDDRTHRPWTDWGAC
ncbi:MAG: helix-turn-helix domain containing protein [Gammaproteobacteria bacterium]|nr:helix-turn-helix domain containing protein [Gammaproteobacteria bacterium]